MTLENHKNIGKRNRKKEIDNKVKWQLTIKKVKTYKGLRAKKEGEEIGGGRIRTDTDGNNNVWRCNKLDKILTAESVMVVKCDL